MNMALKMITCILCSQKALKMFELSFTSHQCYDCDLHIFENKQFPYLYSSLQSYPSVLYRTTSPSVQLIVLKQLSPSQLCILFMSAATVIIEPVICLCCTQVQEDLELFQTVRTAYCSGVLLLLSLSFLQTYLSYYQRHMCLNCHY